MKIFDITYMLKNDMTIYPGDAKFKKEEYTSIKRGDSSNTSIITMGSHNGTHFDAPYHIFSTKKTLDKIDVSIFIGKAQVIEINNDKFIDVEELKKIKIKKGIKRILVKTKNSCLLEKNKPFKKDFIYFTKESAKYLADKGIKLIGVDYLSVDKFNSGTHPAHHEFIKKNIIILETINLYNVEPGIYNFFGAPLLIEKSDSAPARVFLIKE